MIYMLQYKPQKGKMEATGPKCQLCRGGKASVGCGPTPRAVDRRQGRAWFYCTHTHGLFLRKIARRCAFQQLCPPWKTGHPRALWLTESWLSITEAALQHHRDVRNPPLCQRPPASTARVGLGCWVLRHEPWTDLALALSRVPRQALWGKPGPDPGSLLLLRNLFMLISALAWILIHENGRYFLLSG